MMDATCSPQRFSCLSRRLQIPLIFLFIVTCLSIVTGLTETEEPLLLNGVNGGEVIFRCPFRKQSKMTFFYLQKTDEYVNGYHDHLTIPTPKWENTRVDNDFNVHMNQLNISHAGKYTCYIKYVDKTDWEESDIQLSVTANYSKPNVTMSCHDRNCMVTCTSYGGYPKNKVLWDVHALGNASSQMCKFVGSPPKCDKKTQLCNISSTASFNCSFGLQRYISCYIDNTEISSTFSICESDPVPPTAPPDSPTVLVAVFVVALLCVLGLPLLLLLLWKFKKRLRGRPRISFVEEGQSLREERMEKES